MKNLLFIVFCLLPIIIFFIGYFIDNNNLRIILFIIDIPITIIVTKVMEKFLKQIK